MRRIMWGAVVAGLLVSAATAQDSVSKTTGGSDALVPWDTASQAVNYVVDLTPFKSNWDTPFAIGPVLKSTNGAYNYPSCLISAQSMSRLQKLGAEYPVSAYSLWQNAPGYGVHATENYAADTIQPSGSASQFAVTFADYGYATAGTDYCGVNGAVISYDPSNPLRLFVARRLAAINGAQAGYESSTFGVGAVDETGVVMFRADNNGCSGPSTISGNNIFAVDMLARTPNVLNVITSAGGSDAGATDRPIRGSSTVHGVPNIGPTAIFGEPYYLGGNFNVEYLYGPADGAISSTSAHLAPTCTDQRGAVAYMSKNFACFSGATHGTAATLAYGPSSSADTIDVFGLDAAGAPVSPLALTLPATVITDPSTGATTYDPALYGGAVKFDHYHSQTAYQGGVSQVALNIDQAGRLLAAAVLYYDGIPGVAGGYVCPLNAIVAARVNPATCEPEWTLVAYTVDETVGLETGKPILDGPGGSPVGRLAEMNEWSSVYEGPSMSAPMIDAGGNIWFISAVALDKTDTQTGQSYIDYDAGLIRAVYSPATFSYELELVLELGRIFSGANSGLKWRLTYMTLADSNSVSSGTSWSQNIAEDGYLGQPFLAGTSPRDPRALGGMVLNASIVYDVDQDGEYDDANGVDQEYNALLYISAAPEVLCADVNCDGAVNAFDIDPFVVALVSAAQYAADYPNCPITSADVNGDGAVNAFDIDPFVLALVNGGCSN